MKKGLTEVVFILDRSGSMGGLEADTIGGFNAFIEKQRKVEGECVVSTVLFNHYSKVLHDRISLSKIEPLTEEQYSVGGSTALLDAIGDAVHHIGNIHKYAREEDVPEKTIFVITTDGMENSSRNYSYKSVKNQITRQQEKYGWEFLFLGANIDAVGEAARLGIREERAVRYKCDSYGTNLNYESLSEALVTIRSNKVLGRKWKERIEEYENDD
ncbi:MAG: VWA domain-containing protein [Treponema sp.]|nr:VWA domain-containing protein [Treponema sp.]